MANFTGQLNSNEIFGALWNMIISVQTFSNNISLDNTIVDMARRDGTLYGDTKLYYATDVLKTSSWKNDAEAPNLLKLHRPKDPKVQAIQLNVFRKIELTVDYYLSKRAFADEGTFSNYTSVLLGWLNDTKRIYDHTLYNTFIGTNETTLNNQSIVWNDVSVTRPTTDEEAHQDAYAIAENLSNLVNTLTDLTREYTDYGLCRAFSKDNIKIIWNNKYLNRIRKVDLPSIYHTDFMESLFNGYSMNPNYFGKKNTGNTPAGEGVRLLSEEEFDDGQDRFGGELVPSGKESEQTYTEDDSIICKIIVGDVPPFMSAFNVGTSFYNPLSLTENKYLIWGHNTLEHLKNYPYITIRAGKNADHVVNPPSSGETIGGEVDPSGFLVRWDGIHDLPNYSKYQSGYPKEDIDGTPLPDFEKYPEEGNGYPI